MRFLVRLKLHILAGGILILCRPFLSHFRFNIIITVWSWKNRFAASLVLRSPGSQLESTSRGANIQSCSTLRVAALKPHMKFNYIMVTSVSDPVPAPGD